MGTHKAGNRSTAGFRVLFDFTLCEAPHSPACLFGMGIKSLVALDIDGTLPMPIIPISLHNELDGLEHEVGLPTAEHRPVHLEFQAALLEFIPKRLLQYRHFCRHLLAQPGLSNFLTSFRRVLAAKMYLPKEFSCFGRHLPTQACLAIPFPRFRRGRVIGVVSEKALPNLLPAFGCSGQAFWSTAPSRSTRCSVATGACAKPLRPLRRPNGFLSLAHFQQGFGRCLSAYRSLSNLLSCLRSDFMTKGRTLMPLRATHFMFNYNTRGIIGRN